MEGKNKEKKTFPNYINIYKENKSETMSTAASFMKLIVGISNFLSLLLISYSYSVNKIFFWPWLLGDVESKNL